MKGLLRLLTLLRGTQKHLIEDMCCREHDMHAKSLSQMQPKGPRGWNPRNFNDTLPTCKRTLTKNGIDERIECQ
ncbi:hypothetical protein E2C01_015983 [Portunus trituberculatus]|uniref:Uncharacterized protein n=1 Tax=Portunus trituberculatus TaxID=210409 RepID=A0A5B7DPR8_PORTR|nr:hypothetical protein [Portunus trituberculatus]